MYFDTSYRNSGAGALMAYIEKDYPLRNSAGREMSEQEIRNFIDKSERHQFERELQIAPNPYADVSRSQLERETRRFIGEFVNETHSSVRAAYAIHDDNGVQHSHVALTGRRRDLYMDAEDISQSRDLLEERLEPDLGPAPELKQQVELERERQERLKNGPKHEWELDQEQGPDLGPGPEPELEQDYERDHDLEPGDGEGQEPERDQGPRYDFF